MENNDQSPKNDNENIVNSEVILPDGIDQLNIEINKNDNTGNLNINDTTYTINSNNNKDSNIISNPITPTTTTNNNTNTNIKDTNTTTNSIKKEQSLKDYMFSWLKKLYKIFGLRFIIVLIKNKNLLFSFNMNKLLSKIFGLSNLRSVACISLLPLFYKLLVILFEKIKVLSKEIDRKLISIFISSFICILMEERTQLVNYIILAIAVRVVHNLVSLLCKQMNIFQKETKLNNFLFFTMSSILWFLTIFLNPSYKAITGLSDRYSNFGPSEMKEMTHVRSITRLV